MVLNNMQGHSLSDCIQAQILPRITKAIQALPDQVRAWWLQLTITTPLYLVS